MREVCIVSCEIGASQRGPEPWNTEAEDIVGIRYKATTDKDTADPEDLLRAVVSCRACELAIAL
jgi:hypothetical protein